MNELLNKIPTATMQREEWLEERRKCIGGSDAAVIVGMNPYVSPYMLWADKTGKLPEKEDNEAMRQGRDFEEYVASRFTENTGKKVQKMNYMLKSSKYPFASANIDRKIVGEKAGLECKTTSVLNLKRFKDGEYPENYYVQCMHYMAVTGYQKWYLAVLILNKDFMVFEIERDEEEIKALMGAEERFWRDYIETNTPPLLDGLEATTKAMNQLYPRSNLEKKELYEESAIQRYLQLKKQVSDLEKEKERYEQILKQEMENSETGVCGKYTVNWKNKSKNTFDYKKFVKNNPDVDVSQYFKESIYRTFSIKEGE